MSDAIDPQGRFARCPRCQWLDGRGRQTCPQCGERWPSRPSEPPPAISLAIEPQRSAPLDVPLARIAEARGRWELPRTRSSPLTRALETSHGRCVILAPDRSALCAALVEAALEIALRRGSLALAAHGSDALRDALLATELRAARSCADAPLFVSDASLALTAAQRNAATQAPFALLGVADAESAPSLREVHALYSVVAPERVRTERWFCARFRGAESLASSVDDAALGALLAPRTLRVEPARPLAPPLAALDRWLRSAPRG